MEQIIKKLENKMVYIESQEMLEEARELIEGKGMRVNPDKDIFGWAENHEPVNYLFFGKTDHLFALAHKPSHVTEITFEQFKTIMS